MLAIVLTEAAAIVLLGVLVTGLLRSHAEILRGLRELGIDLDPDRRDRAGPAPIAGPSRLTADRQAHDLAGERLDGSAVAVGIAGTDRHTLLAFLSSTCAGCRPFWSALAAGATAPLGARTVVVVDSADSRSRLRDLAPADLDVVVSADAWRDYQVPGSPHFTLVDGPTARVVGEGTGATWEQVCDLLVHAIGAGPEHDGGRDNAVRIDAELAASGIGPDHPSLRPTRTDGSTPA